jgi:hypothetical protein
VAESVYILCMLTSAAVAFLLLRAYSSTRARILFWSGLGFVGLALNNVLLVIDLMVVPQTDLSMVRNLPSLVGMALLLYGLIWEAEK